MFGVIDPLAPEDGVTVYVLIANIAFSVESAFILKMQLPVPVHEEADPVPPDHVEKFEFVPGVAVTVTTVFESYASKQSVPQFMPVVVTVPVPVPDLEIVKVFFGMNVAVIVVSAFIVIVHVCVPLHSGFDQPVKVELESGVAFRVIETFGLYSSEQSVPQFMPVTVITSA